MYDCIYSFCARSSLMIHRVANSMRSSTLGLICMFINHLYPQTKGLSSSLLIWVPLLKS